MFQAHSAGPPKTSVAPEQKTSGTIHDSPSDTRGFFERSLEERWNYLQWIAQVPCGQRFGTWPLHFWQTADQFLFDVGVCLIDLEKEREKRTR